MAFDVPWLEKKKKIGSITKNKGEKNIRVMIPGSGRSPGGGQGNPLRYSCLENPMDKRSLAGYGP